MFTVINLIKSKSLKAKHLKFLVTKISVWKNLRLEIDCIFDINNSFKRRK